MTTYAQPRQNRELHLADVTFAPSIGTEQPAVEAVGTWTSADVWISAPLLSEAGVLTTWGGGGKIQLWGEAGSARVVLAERDLALIDGNKSGPLLRLNALALSVRGRPCTAFRVVLVHAAAPVAVSGRGLVSLEVWDDACCPLPSDLPGNEQNGAMHSATSSVPVSIVSVLILPANPNRKGFTVWNDAVGTTLLLKLGLGATLADNTVPIVPGAYFEVPFDYRGPVSGIWTAAFAGGFARVTEILP